MTAHPGGGPRAHAAESGALWAVVAHVGSLDADARAAFEVAIRSSASDPGGRVVVATCHRAEVYGVGRTPQWAVRETVERGLVRLDGEAAVTHAFRLAAGLESAVLGEDQVLAQVRDALRSAQSEGGLDPRLNRLFQDAVRVGRRARATVRPRVRDLAEPALDVLAASIGDLSGRRILVVGSGPMGATAASAASRRGARVVVAAAVGPDGSILAERPFGLPAGPALRDAVREATLLELSPGAPILRAEQRSFDPAGRPVQWCRMSYRGDRYRFRTTLIRRA